MLPARDKERPMTDIRLAKSIRSIVALKAGPLGQVEPVEIYRRDEGEKKKKGTRLLRPVDRAVRRLARAQHA